MAKKTNKATATPTTGATGTTKPAGDRITSRLSPHWTLEERIQMLGLSLIVQTYTPDTDVLQIMQDQEDQLAAGGVTLRTLASLSHLSLEDRFNILCGYCDQLTTAAPLPFARYLKDVAELLPAAEVAVEPAKASKSKKDAGPTKVSADPAEFPLPPDSVSQQDAVSPEVVVDPIPADEDPGEAIDPEEDLVELHIPHETMVRVNQRLTPGAVSEEMINPHTQAIEDLVDMPFPWTTALGEEGALLVRQVYNAATGIPDLDFAVCIPQGDNDIYVRELMWDGELVEGDYVLTGHPESHKHMAVMCPDVVVRVIIDPPVVVAPAVPSRVRSSVPRPATAPVDAAPPAPTTAPAVSVVQPTTPRSAGPVRTTATTARTGTPVTTTPVTPVAGAAGPIRTAGPVKTSGPRRPS